MPDSAPASAPGATPEEAAPDPQTHQRLVEAMAQPALLVSGGLSLVANNAAGTPLATLFQGKTATSASVRAQNVLATMVAGTLTHRLPESGRVAVPDPASGTERLFVLSSVLIEAAGPVGGAPGLILLLGHEITFESNLITALKSSREMYRDLLHCAADMVWETDANGHFTYVRGADIIGLSDSFLTGTAVADEIVPRIDGAGAEIFSARKSVDSAELWLTGTDGRQCLVLSARPIQGRDGGWAGTRGVARDITQDKLAEAEREKRRQREANRLRKLSSLDVLTGLLNRRAFEADIRLQMKQASGEASAFLFLDFDDFKIINDTNGHAAGDAALKAVAQTLESLKRGSDLAARLGGDELALWLSGSDARGVEHFLMRLSDRLTAKVAGSLGFPVGLSIGVAIWSSSGGEDLPQLMARADKALYAAKAAGKGCWRVAPDHDHDAEHEDNRSC